MVTVSGWWRLAPSGVVAKRRRDVGRRGAGTQPCCVAYWRRGVVVNDDVVDSVVAWRVQLTVAARTAWY